MTLARPFSAFLSCSQRSATSSALPAATSPNTWGWRPTSLSCDAPGHVGQGEPALLGRQRGVEHDLEQQVAQLLLQGVEALAGLDVQAVERLQHLVRLLQQVAPQAVVGLLPVPRALGPQAADDLGERRHLAGDRAPPAGAGTRDVRWSGSTDRSSSCHGTSVTSSSCEAQALEHDGDRLGVVAVARVDQLAHRQLDLGQHAPAVALPHEQRPPLPRRVPGEAVAVDQAHPGLHGVDAEPHPGQVDEGQARHQLDRHPVVGQQPLDGVLGHQRRPGHGVEDLAVGGGRGNEPLDDGGVHVLDARRPRS